MKHKKQEIVTLLILRTIGNFLILFTIFGFSMTFGPAIYFEILFHLAQYQGVHFQVAQMAQGEELTPLGKLVEMHATGSGSTNGESGQSYLGAILSGQKTQTLIPQSTQ